MCVVYLEPSSYAGTHPVTQTMNFSELSGKRGHRSSLLGCKQTKKNNGVQKTQTLPMVHCGPHTLEVTNVNAMASNLLRTRFKS